MKSLLRMRNDMNFASNTVGVEQIGTVNVMCEAIKCTFPRTSEHASRSDMAGYCESFFASDTKSSCIFAGLVRICERTN